MQRAVMGAAVIQLGQDQVRIGGEGAIGKEHRLDPAAQLVVGQEQQVLAHHRLDPRFFLHLHPLFVTCPGYGSVVDFLIRDC